MQRGPLFTHLREKISFYLVRAIWFVMALGVILLSGYGAFHQYRNLIQEGSDLVLVRAGLPLQTSALLLILIDFIPAVASFFLGVLLFLRVLIHHNADRMVIFTSFLFLSFSLLINNNANAIPDNSIWLLLFYLLIAVVGLILFLFFFVVFPDGHIRPAWAWIFPVGILVWILSWFITPLLNPQNWSNLAFSLLTGSLLLIGVSLQVFRYLHFSTPVQRQQTKMVCFSLVFLLLFGFLEIYTENALLPRLEPGPYGHWFALASQLISAVGVTVFPIILAIAIMRYRLWDIDNLINQALVYAVLTATLVLVYLGTVVILQQVFYWISGQTGAPAIILSTLTIAGLFSPMRDRIQILIDRRFYRNKYDAVRTLEKFNSRLRDELSLDQLVFQIREVVSETMHPSMISIWVRGQHGSDEFLKK